MNILGIYGALGWNPHDLEQVKDDPGGHAAAWVHDSGASLFKNGEHVVSIQNERLTRIKYDGQFPDASIKYCLQVGELEEEQVDKLCVAIPSSFHFYDAYYNKHVIAVLQERFPNAEIKFYGHHHCHAAAAVYTSDQESGSFVTSDGSGQQYLAEATPSDEGMLTAKVGVERSTMGYFDKTKNTFQLFHDLPYTNSFGGHWAVVSELIYAEKMGTPEIIARDEDNNFYGLGDRATFDAMHGKVMGLCAYGQDEASDDFSDIKYFQTSDDLVFETRPYVCLHNHAQLAVYNNKDLSPEYKAYVLQRNHEEAMRWLLNTYRDRAYTTDNICLSGGSFLNVKANTLVHKQNKYKNIHISPACTDVGLHLGAACIGVTENNMRVRMPDNICLLGREYSDIELDNFVTHLNDQKNIAITKLDTNLNEYVANQLADNKIVAWFQGRSEFGPRALGSRSILMHPGPAENKDTLNHRVKHREEWRPFAGIILEEHLTEYFEENIVSPYMMYALTVKKDMAPRIRAITHYDYSCRIQTVNNKYNRKMTALINEFYKQTNIPVLLNTSFNDNGEPIVETPADALAAFLKMDIDLLVLGNYVIEKI
jgi:carbamoyltransferase